MTGVAAGIGSLQHAAAAGIPTEYREAVAVQLAALLLQARLVQEFPLPDDTEPAPVFTP
jgi:hypothetical protein